MRLAILEFTNVFVIVDPGIGALSVSFPVLELTDVFVPFKSPYLKVESAETIVPSTGFLN